jgi:hypothetical protein
VGSLVERSTPRLEAPVVAGYSESPAFIDLPARQQAMARALAGSFAGVFTVHDRRESEITLEDVAGGHRYLVHEHNGEIAYHPEYLALGRLIPFGPGRYLLLTRDGVPGVARSGARSRARQTPGDAARSRARAACAPGPGTARRQAPRIADPQLRSTVVNLTNPALRSALACLAVLRGS